MPNESVLDLFHPVEGMIAAWLRLVDRVDLVVALRTAPEQLLLHRARNASIDHGFRMIRPLSDVEQLQPTLEGVCKGYRGSNIIPVNANRVRSHTGEG